MDISLAPKLIAAAIVGATASASLSRFAVSDTVMLKLEWVQSGNNKVSETLNLRATNDRATTIHQGDRVIEATPSVADDGTYYVDLKVTTDSSKTAPEVLSTQVHVTAGDTVVVMGTVRKEGKGFQQRSFFLTANPL